MMIPFSFQCDGKIRKGARATSQMNVIINRRFNLHGMAVVTTTGTLWMIRIDGRALSFKPIPSDELGSPQTPLRAYPPLRIKEGSRIECRITTADRMKTDKTIRLQIVFFGFAGT